MTNKVKLTCNTAEVLNYGFRFKSHCDVEIQIQGGWKIYAHSFYLASCSAVLKECLESVRIGTLPVIYLPDVRPNVIEGLLQFIYTGEVNLHQTDVADFVSLGKMLQIDSVVETMESDNFNNDHTSNFDAEDPLNSEDEVLENDEETMFDASEDSNSASNNIIFIPTNNKNDTYVEESSDDDEEEEELRKLKPHKRNQIICKKNLSLFKERLFYSLAKQYNILGITVNDSMKQNMIINMNKNPRWIDCDTVCLVCKKPLKIHARVHSDQKRFLQWRIGNFHKYHIKRHAEEKEKGIKCEENTEDYGDFEMSETCMETDVNEKQKTEYFVGSLTICEENAQELKRRLLKAVNSAILRSNISNKLQKAKQKINFWIGGDPIEIKARYECCVCKRSLAIPSKKNKMQFKQWSTSSLKKHLDLHK